MSRVNLKILLFCVVSFQVCNLLGQFSNRIHEQLRFKKFTIENGLANDRVIGITQDNYGFMWFGTLKGVSKYDGYEFKSYLRYYTDENDSIGSLITGIYQAKCDTNGTVWMAGLFGICYFDRVLDKFIRFAPAELDAEITISRDITEDHSGNIYFATIAGIIKHNIYTKENVFYIQDDKNPNSIPVGLIHNIFYDSRGLLWITVMENGAGYLDQKTGIIKWYMADGTPGSLGENLSQRIYEDSKNNIWIGHDNQGASKFDFKTNTFRVYIPDRTLKNSGTVRGLVEDSQGTFWFGTMEGLYIFNPESETFYRYAHTTHPISQLSHNSILNMFIDDHDGMWLGTRAGGVNYTNLYTSGFVNYEFSIFDSEYYLNNNNVYGFAFDNEDNIWVATESGGVNYLDRETGKFTYYMYDPDHVNSPRSNNIKTIYIDNDEKIYIGTYRGGISILDKKTGTYEHLLFPQDIEDHIVYNITPDVADKNILWIGALYNTYLFNKKELKLTLLNESTPGFVNPKTLPRIYSICHTGDNKMIFGSYILTILDRANNEFTYIDKVGNIEINSVNFVLIDKNGFLWASINLDFIVKYDLLKNEFEIFNEEDGLPDLEFIQAQEDIMGNLWVSTNRGIIKLENIINSSDDFKIAQYDNSDNLQGLEFLYGSSAKSRSGELWFGGTNGFNSFRPENVKPNPYVPNVIVTKFSVLGKEVNVGEEVFGKVLLTKPIMETKQIRIHHKIKMFAFDFTGFHFVAPENNKFKYILEGYDKEWHYTSASIRKATYSNLPGGKYTFKVDGSNNNGIFSGKPFELAIKVVPPFWHTIWFRILFILLIIILLSGIYFYRIISLNRQKIYLESLVKKRTSEIEDKNKQLLEQTYLLNETNTLLEERQQFIEEQSEELRTQAEELNDKNQNLRTLNMTKDKFFSIIAHDLKNPFNAVLGFAELLSIKYEALPDAKRKQYVDLISDSVKKIYKLLENLLQWARSQTGNIPYKPENFLLGEVINNNIELSANQ
ncbi:MAG: two-component regulator propeller domain-containing protein, partial [Bacteroidales bacterium]